MHQRPICCLLIVAAVGLCSSPAAPAEPAPPKPRSASAEFSKDQIAFFENSVRPILKQNCFGCHGSKKTQGGLRLDHRAGLLTGGESGPAVSLEKPADSLLLEAINYESYEMPPAGKLPAEQIAVLTRWVTMGVPWTPGAAVEPIKQTAKHSPAVNDETRSFWSYQPVKRPSVPAVKQQSWVQSPIDAFILAKLEAHGLAPAEPASKNVLIRRVYYNLIGLPPSPAEVAAFLADDSPQAYERMIDRLLASPHYGEQWGRHWLDLVRYAETNSYERDGVKPFVWRYRDYVIRSFNEDKPYDTFIREQLAGDELDKPTTDSIIATGYYRLGAWDDEPADPEKAYYDDLNDILSTTCETMLGMTIGCARCHEHKLDPIPHADYYRMAAFFNNIRRYGVRSHQSVEEASVQMVGPEEALRRHEWELAQWKRELAETEKQLKQIDEIIQPKLVGGEVDDFKHESTRVDIARHHIPEVLSQQQFDRYVQLTAKRDELRKSEPEGLAQVLCVKELGAQPRPTHVLVRGNAGVPGLEVQPGFPQVLGFDDPVLAQPAADAHSCGRRRVFADWVASPRNPLTARVIVNRIWQFHFGQGLVRTPSDFGLQGARPTHPELLDWLADEFVQGGWRFKRMHKLLLLSNVFRLSSAGSAAAVEQDPQNELLARFNMRRLTAEEIRDSILAVDGSLNLQSMYGPSIYAKIPAAVLAGQSRPGQGWGESPPTERSRRSIYIHVKRSLLTPVLASFDYPEPDFACPVRFVSTQPTQALGMLNSEFINEQAAVFAKYLRDQAGDDFGRQVEVALRRVMQRKPTATEIEQGRALIERLQQQHQATRETAVKQFCIVALNLNEFFYLD